MFDVSRLSPVQQPQPTNASRRVFYVLSGLLAFTGPSLIHPHTRDMNSEMTDHVPVKTSGWQSDSYDDISANLQPTVSEIHESKDQKRKDTRVNKVNMTMSWIEYPQHGQPLVSKTDMSKTHWLHHSCSEALCPPVVGLDISLIMKLKRPFSHFSHCWCGKVDCCSSNCIPSSCTNWLR